MYLQTAASIEGILEHGIKPLIAFTDALEAAREGEENEEADLYQLEIKGRLLRVKERMESMIENQIRTRKGREVLHEIN